MTSWQWDFCSALLLKPVVGSLQHGAPCWNHWFFSSQALFIYWLIGSVEFIFLGLLHDYSRVGFHIHVGHLHLAALHLCKISHIEMISMDCSVYIYTGRGLVMGQTNLMKINEEWWENMCAERCEFRVDCRAVIYFSGRTQHGPKIEGKAQIQKMSVTPPLFFFPPPLAACTEIR